MNKGKWLLIVGVIILVGAGIWIWQAADVETGSSSPSVGAQIAEGLLPELDVVNLDISSISGERIEAVAQAELSNPFPVDISTNRIDYEIFIDSIKVIEDAYEEPLKISPEGSADIELPMEILKDPITRVMDYFSRNQVDSAHYSINLNIQLDVPIAGEEEFNIELSDTMPAFQLTDIELENIDLNVLSSDDGIDMVLRVTNPNVYDITMVNANFYLVIDDDLELEGNLEDYISIPARTTEDVALHIQKERGSYTQTGWNYLFDQEGTRFTYYLSYTMESENDFIDGSVIEAEVRGTLAELSNTM